MRWPDDFRNWPHSSERPQRSPRPPAASRPQGAERALPPSEEHELGATIPCSSCGADMPRLWFVDRCPACGAIQAR